MSFEMVELGTVSDITKLAGFEFTKYIKYIDDGDVIALRALNLRHGELDLTDIKKIERSVSDSLVRSKLYKNDILLTYTGNGYGDCALITENDKYHLAPNICKITPDEEKINPYYLYAYIRSPMFYKIMSNHMVGSSQPTIPMKTIRTLDVPLPSREIQDKIARFVLAIDERMRTNNAIGSILAEQAEAVFEHELVENANPEWAHDNLAGIANYLNGLAMQKYRPADGDEGLPVLKIRELRQGFCDPNGEKCSSMIDDQYKVYDGDVIFSWSGSLLVDFWCGGECGLNQHLFKVTSEKYDKWFYYAWTLHHLNRFILIAADKATTMGHIKREELTKAEVLIPSEAEYNKIGKKISPMYERIISGRLENRILAETRDEAFYSMLNGDVDFEHLSFGG